MRLYRYRDGHGVAVTKDLDEVEFLRKLGCYCHPDSPFSMERYSKPQEKLWYDFSFPADKWAEVEAGAKRG